MTGLGAILPRKHPGKGRGPSGWAMSLVRRRSCQRAGGRADDDDGVLFEARSRQHHFSSRSRFRKSWSSFRVGRGASRWRSSWTKYVHTYICTCAAADGMLHSVDAGNSSSPQAKEEPSSTLGCVLMVGSPRAAGCSEGGPRFGKRTSTCTFIGQRFETRAKGKSL